MALADLLGSPDNLLGLPPRPAYGGYQYDLPPQQAAHQAPPQAAMPGYRPPSGIHRFLDSIGDALLVANGGPPIHRQHMQEAQAQSALQGFLTDPDQAIAQLMQVDAPTGIALWKSMHPGSERTELQKDYEYLKGVDPKAADEFLHNKTQGAPLIANNGDGTFTIIPRNTIAPQSSGGAPSVGAVEDGYRFKGGDPAKQENWEPVQGGQTAQPSGGFPVSKVLDALTAQESGGNGNALSPAGALGSTQLMPGTAKQMAAKRGLAFVPSMLRSSDPKALKYQRSLAEAYFAEGLQKTGNLRDALRYYHGGPDTAQWGPKTNAYADAVLARLGGR